MLAAFNGNSIFEGPGLYFVTHLGLFLDRLDPKAPTGVLLGTPWGVRPAKVGSVGEALKNGLSD